MPTNQFITTSKVAKLALEVLENETVFARGLNKQYSEEFAQKGANQIGYTVNAKKPPRYLVGEGPVIDPQSTVQTYVPVTISHQLNVPVSVQTSDYTLSLDNFQETILKPAVAELANKIDQTAINELYPYVANFIVPDGGLGSLDGRTSTAAQAIGTIGTADQILTEMAAPENDRMACIAPKVNTGLVTAYSSLFNPQKDGERRFMEGSIGKALNFEFGRDVNIAMLTNGTLNATAATGSAAQGGGNSVQSDQTTPFALTIAAPGATIKVGQVITIAGIYAVNPRARQSLGRLQTFTVVGNGTAGSDVGASDTVMQILPYPVFTGAFQNVYSATNNIPGSSTITSVSGLNSSAYTQNLFYHPNAFTLVTARLWTPQNSGNGEAGFAYSSKTGLSIRFIKDWYDARSDQAITRLDVLMGVKAVYPELACRVSG